MKTKLKVIAAVVGLPPAGIVKDIVLRQILGLPIPKDYPQWIIDRAREEAGA
jgi:hypothetical protein